MRFCNPRLVSGLISYFKSVFIKLAQGMLVSFLILLVVYSDSHLVVCPFVEYSTRCANFTLYFSFVSESLVFVCEMLVCSAMFPTECNSIYFFAIDC